MTLIKVKCVFCGKKFFRELRRFNEAKKFGWKQYCSLKCQSLTKNKQKTLECGNPKCHKTFKRLLSGIPLSGICFCSKSCAAIVNNPKSPKRRPKIRICPSCGNQFTGRKKYCSRKCQPKPSKISENQIIKEIFIEFFGLHGELRIYDQYMRKKLRLIKNNNLKLISIYPKDLFPKPRLNYVLYDLIK